MWIGSAKSAVCPVDPRCCHARPARNNSAGSPPADRAEHVVRSGSLNLDAPRELVCFGVARCVMMRLMMLGFTERAERASSGRRRPARCRAGTGAP